MDRGLGGLDTGGRRRRLGRTGQRQVRKPAAQDIDRELDRWGAIELLDLALFGGDLRARHSAQMVLRGHASLFVATARWDSDELVHDPLEPRYADGARIAYVGAHPVRDRPLIEGGLVQPDSIRAGRNPRFNEQHDLHSASTKGASDSMGRKATITIYAPGTIHTDAEDAFRTLRHEAQHVADRTVDLIEDGGLTLGAAAANVPKAVRDAQARGLAEFLTEQRAYTLEEAGHGYDDLGENPKYVVTDAVEPALEVRVGRELPLGAAQRWLGWNGPGALKRLTTLLPPDLVPLATSAADGSGFGGTFFALEHSGWARRHEGVPSGTARLVRDLMRDGYENFIVAWLLDDLWGQESDERPFQTAVLSARPEYANPLNSPRIHELWTAARGPAPEFTRALEALEEDELCFLTDSAAFARHLCRVADRELQRAFWGYAR